MQDIFSIGNCDSILDAFFQNEFIKISIEENDTLSSYIAGYISDIYLHDIERAISNYESFILNYSESIYSDIVHSRLDEIQLNLEETKQKIY